MKKTYFIARFIAVFSFLSCFSFFGFAQGDITYISNETELRQHLEGRTTNVGISGHYKLTSNIMLSGNWTPSWRLDEGAILDGDGYVISGLNIPAAGLDNSAGFLIYLRGTIKNLGFENATVNAKGNTGVIVGVMKGGSIDNCYVKNSTVAGTGDAVGGIVGSVEKGNLGGASITKCYVDNSSVTGGASRVGGIAGNIGHEAANPGYITECYVTDSSIRANGAEMAGGIAGRVSSYVTIEKCYVENSNVYGPKDTGGIAGRLHNNSTIKLSYSASTVVNGNDNVGGISGRFYGPGVIVENCYSSADVNSREWQTGGLVGQATDGSKETINGTILNSYFSGISRRPGGNRASGILGLMGVDNVIVQNCATLADEIISNERYRIVSFGTRPSTVVNNYALETIPVTTGNENENGINVSEAAAKTEAFYKTTLGWTDFDDNWKMPGDGYPVLKWQDTPVEITLSGVKDIYLLQAGGVIDLKEIKSLRGLNLTFNCTNDKISIADNKATLSGTVTSPEDAVITVSTNNDYVIKNNTLAVKLMPTGAIKLSTPADFALVGSNPSLDFELSNDINFSNTSFTGITETFTGTFNGNGYSLKNITINKRNPDQNEVAIFKKIEGATISNLVIDNASVTGKNQTGILVALMRGASIVENCAVINSYLLGGDHVGALVSNMEGGGTVRNSYCTSYLYADAGWLGGIVGMLKGGTVENCYYSGNVHNGNNGAGLIGRTEGDAANNIVKNNVCLAAEVYAYWEWRYRILGANGSASTLSNNYSLSTTIIRGDNTGGGANPLLNSIVPLENPQYGADKFHGANIPASFGGDAGAQKQAFYENLGWDFTTNWTIDEEKAYPVLKLQKSKPLSVFGTDELSFIAGNELELSSVFTTNGLNIVLTFTSDDSLIDIQGNKVTNTGNVGAPTQVTVTATPTGTSFAPYSFNITILPGVLEIATAADLDLFNQYRAGDFMLVNNIDMTGVSFAGLCSDSNPFTGTFDGKGYVIKGLKIEKSNENQDQGGNLLGLFRKTVGATIKNLGIDNAEIVGNEDIGGIAGWADNTTIEQCFVINSTIEARDRAGSIAGRLVNGATLENCYAVADVKAREHQAGGLVGSTVAGGGAILKSYFGGTVTGLHNRNCGILGLMDANVATNKVENCVSLASALNGGSASTFRIADNNNNGTLSNNYSLAWALCNGNIIQPDNENYGTDKKHGADIPDNKQTDITFYESIDWSFENVWTMGNDEYPLPVLKGFAAGSQPDAYPEFLKLTITIESGSNGTVNITGENKVKPGENSVLTVLPDEGYKIASFTVNGEDKSADLINNEYTLENINQNYTVAATFTAITFVINTTAGEGGSISQHADVAWNTDVTITVTPEEAYKVATFTVNGEDKLAELVNNEYTIQNVKEEYTVGVTFTLKTFAINTTAGEGGSISQHTDVVWDNDVTITVTPAEGYEIASFTVNGEDKLAELVNNEYTIQNVKEEYTVAVTFTLKTFTITTTAGEGGSISQHDAAVWGSNITVTVTPDAGYKVAAFTVNNEDKLAGLTNNQYALNGIRQNYDIQVTFVTDGTDLETISTRILVYQKENMVHVVNKTDESVVTLYNAVGTVLYTTLESVIDLSSYSSGLYLLEINGRIHKLVKK